MARHPVATRRRNGLACAVAAFSALLLAPFAPAESLDPAPVFEEPRLLHPQPEQANPLRMATLRSPFQPAAVSSRVRRLMLQYEALVEDEAWDEAIELVERLAVEHGEELVVAEDAAEPFSKVKRYVPLSTRRARMLAALPEAGRQAYRDRVERSARRRLDEAARRLDEHALAAVGDEYAASETASEALLLQAELALERGDTTAVRRCCARLAAYASDPWGRPAAATLVTLDPNALPTALAEAWLETVEGEQDASAGLDDTMAAQVLVRLALASLREGDLRRADAEVRLLEALAPEASGRLAGRVQPLAPALRQMISGKRSSTARRAAGPRAPLAWAWERAAEFRAIPTTQRIQALRRWNAFNGAGRQLIVNPVPAVNAVPNASPSLRAATDGDAAYYVDAVGLTRLDLATGETGRVLLPGETPTPVDAPQQPGLGDLAAIGGAGGRRGLVINGQAIRVGPRVVQRAGRPRQITPSPRLRPSMTLADGVLFGVLSAPVAANRRGPMPAGLPGEELIGLDLEQDAKVVVRIASPKEGLVGEPSANTRGYGFGGAPAVRGDRLYAAVTRRGVRTDLAIACYDLPSGQRRWWTDLGSGEPMQIVSYAQPAGLTLAGDTLYVATNLGAVAALDTSDGRLRWVSAYERDAAKRSHTGPLPPRPCVVVGDAVVVAPADSTRVMALDAGSGRSLWDAPRPDEESLIAGVHRGAAGSVVALAGRRAAAYDALTGERRFVWPESRRAGLTGRGEATVVGSELFWPTKQALYAIDLESGGFSRAPVDLTPVGAAGANVFAAGGGLLVAGPTQVQLLAAYGDAPLGEPTVSRMRPNRGVALRAVASPTSPTLNPQPLLPTQ